MELDKLREKINTTEKAEKPPRTDAKLRLVSSSYEDALATRMLATQCACCGRPLVDAVSVETGMGPECRKRHLKDVPVDEDTRKAVNALIYEIALKQSGMEIAAPLDELRKLGYDRLVKRIEKRCVPVRIEEKDGRLLVRTPYDVDSVRAWRAIPGRRWDGEEKANTIPVGQRHSLWSLLRRFYPGALVVGPKGTFEIPANE
jgi:hypothetical protein